MFTLVSIDVYLWTQFEFKFNSYALAWMALLAMLNSALIQDAVRYNMSFALIWMIITLWSKWSICIKIKLFTGQLSDVELE